MQPVIPFPLDSDRKLTSRTIIPLHPVRAGRASATGSRTPSFALEKSERADLGLSPVFLLPTATHNWLGLGKFGMTVTGVVLKQSGPHTVGALANHLWLVSGDKVPPADISATYLQAFLSYTLCRGQTLSLASE